MAWFQKLVHRWRSNQQGISARKFEHDDNYPAAAEAYAKQADLDLPDNELIYADECRYAFGMWMKAGNAEKALEQARRALGGYTRGDWLKGDNSYIDGLTEMVGDLRKADHVDEADALLTDINKYLVSVGEKPVEVAVLGQQKKYPNVCPHCGGEITYHGTLDEIACPFCNAVVHAL